MLAVKDLVELTEYIFRVTAENDAGLGKPSEPSQVVVPKDPFSKPSAPGQPTVDEIRKVCQSVSHSFIPLCSQ